MKKFLSVALLLSLAACDNYETLRDQFNFKTNKLFDFAGANSSQRTGVPVETQNMPLTKTADGKTTLASTPVPVSPTNSYEVSVNAPAGSTMAQAMSIFKNEARKVCGGDNYTQKVTSSGMQPIREYGMKQVKSIQVPSIKGIVTCGTATGDNVAVPVAPVSEM